MPTEHSRSCLTNGDDWHSITDARERKKVQDRLAQRARQLIIDPHHLPCNALNAEALTSNLKWGIRLREAKENKIDDIQSSDQTIVGSEHPAPPSHSAPVGLFNAELCYSESTSISTPEDHPRTYQQSSSLTYELPYRLTVAGALFINGQILGLTCCVIIPARSSPASPDVPLSLRPTATQLLTIHSTGIDRFPFPKLRDNVINLSAIIDEEEISRDLILAPSFSITPGAVPWDPRAWKIEKPFAEKWGYLFH